MEVRREVGVVPLVALGFHLERRILSVHLRGDKGAAVSWLKSRAPIIAQALPQASRATVPTSWVPTSNNSPDSLTGSLLPSGSCSSMVSLPSAISLRPCPLLPAPRRHFVDMHSSHWRAKKRVKRRAPANSAHGNRAAQVVERPLYRAARPSAPPGF